MSDASEMFQLAGRMASEMSGYREVLRDLAEHGTRHDLIPTHVPGDEAFWHRYVKSMDDNVRSRARNALDGGAR